MPFLTEEIWQALPHAADNQVKFLMLQSWPQAQAGLAFPQEEKAVEMLMEAVKAVRARRSEMNVPPSKKAHLTIATQEADIFTAGIPFLKRLGYASQVTVTAPPVWAATRRRPPRAWSPSSPTQPASVCPWAELVDLEKEKARIAKELKKNRGELEKLSNKLNNPSLPGQSAGAGCRRGKGAGGKTHRSDHPAGGPGSLPVSKILYLSSPLWQPRPS